MSQPTNRLCSLPELGEVDREAGEFWVENPLKLPQQGENLSAYERNCLFVGVDGRAFIDASFASRADIDSDSRSVIAADLDGDGAVDILVGSVGGGPLRAFQNRQPQGNRLQIRLHGATGNTLGIGARITATIGPRRIVRDMFPVNGFMGLGPAEVWLGTGSATQVDELTIRWPHGETQTLKNVPVNKRLLITEDKTEPEILGEFEASGP